jgi:hypothetical protein
LMRVLPGIEKEMQSGPFHDTVATGTENKATSGVVRMECL